MNESLVEALAMHQRGLVEEATQAYETILDRSPEDADALHLLGIASLQKGDIVRAVELISKAVALDPSVPSLHSNLGEALLRLGQLDSAVRCCRVALCLLPSCAEAASTLGLALHAQGKSDEALVPLREAVRLRPDLAMHHNNLGKALWSKGEEVEALACFRQALEIDANLAEAHNNLGEALRERRQWDEALFHCREAIRLRPDFAEAHSNLGSVFFAQGKKQEAMDCYAEALRLDPGLATVHRDMARAFYKEDRLTEAADSYRKALENDPYSARLHAEVASFLTTRFQYQDAFIRCQGALAIDSDCAEAHNALGYIHYEMGNLEQAQKCYEEALRLKPGFASACFNLGLVLDGTCDEDTVIRYMRETLQHEPSFVLAYAKLASLLGSRLPEADFHAMEHFAANGQVSDSNRASYHFALAHVLDAQGKFDHAAHHMRLANQLSHSVQLKRGEAFDQAQYTQFVDDVLRTFTASFFAHRRGWGLDTELPIFIVGLPRSGTTLVEQILASHSQVHGAGELRYVMDSFQFLPHVMGRSTTPFECLDELERDQTCLVAQRHLDRLRQLNSTADFITDKMPENFCYLGFIALLFPRAKVIHCRRDLRDVAVSCWMTDFARVHWANTADDIAHHFHEYRRIVEHWNEVLPIPVLDIDYEDLVGDPEFVARRLIEWCGLEWEPACLAFHQTRRPVRTASVDQVRRPIYKRSVGRWKNYEETLGELFAKLGMEVSVPCPS